MQKKMNPNIDLEDMAYLTRWRPQDNTKGKQEQNEKDQEIAKANAGATKSELEIGQQKE